MWDEIQAIGAAVRQLQAQMKTLLPAEPPPPVPTEDPERAKLAYEAAQAEVKNQQERAKLNLEAAQANEKRAKEILDASQAAAKAAEAAEHSAQRPAATEQPAERRR